MSHPTQTGRAIALLFWTALAVSSIAKAQSSDSATPTDSPSHAPAQTIRIGKTYFYYYRSPEAVVATTTFYLSASETKAVLFDFVAMNVAFYNSGKRLTTPAFVRFYITAGTYRDGCKYKDRYADRASNQLETNILADEQVLFATKLDLPPTTMVKTRHGNVCTEVYGFQMPYGKFVRLSDAKVAELRLGARQFKFKSNYLVALRTMKEGIGRF